MPHLNRRHFLAAGAGLAGAGMLGTAARAAPFFQRHGLPIGIQLYTLGPDAAKDLDGTLRAVAGIGYRTVESAGFAGRTAAQFRAALDQAGLACTSAHIAGRGGLDGDLAKLADDIRTVGAAHAVMPSPYIPDHVLKAAEGATGIDFYRKVNGALTADDWKMNADFLNAKARVLRASGITVGYHNHNFEFAPVGDSTGLEILLANTDPALVTFELDVGWAAAAGVDPVAYLAQHKGRFSLMHVKDLKATSKPNFDLRMDPTEIGSGELDWARLLPAAHAAGVRGFFVEQEPPFERPRIEAAKISHDYLARVSG